MKIKSSIMEILHGDILSIETQAVYCPDTMHIAMNFGLSGIIKTKTRDELYFATRNLVPMKLGEIASIEVKGLAATHIIFAAVIENSGEINRDLVGKTITDSLDLCSKMGLKSISFPMITSPRSRVPFDIYAKIILKSIVDYLFKNEGNSLNVSFVIFNDEAYSNAKMHLDIIRQEYLI